MRRTLVAAVALAPLCLVASRGAAFATDSITSSVNAPIATATATGGAPDSIDVTSGGSVSVSGTSPAVTLNSGTTAAPTNVTNEGSISISGVNGSTAIQATGGVGGISNSGSITNSESFSVKTNGDGFNDAPFASPTSAGRSGISVTGGLVGDVINSGTLTVQGNTSSAISIQAPLTGNLEQSGTVTYTGDNGTAIQSTAAGSISGNVLVEGTVTSLGQGSRAIDLEGNVGGRISIYSSITSTGYATSTRPTTSSNLNSVQSTADQVQQSLGAVTINGGVGGGILIGAPPVGTSSATATTVDLDGDGIPDVDEGTGSITNFGSAAALTIGNSGTTGAVIGAVGGVDTTAAASSFQSTNNYGLIIRGAISGQGVYDGVTATGLQIGSGSTASPVTLVGGVRITGSINADAYEASSTAIHITAGAVAPEIRNEDFIESSVSNSVASGVDLAGTINPTAAAGGILIDAKASVSTISNFGTIQASANGDNMTAFAVRDLSGTVSTVTNQGVISAIVTPVTAGLSLPSSTNTEPNIALDLQYNTTGVALTQSVNLNPVAIETTTTTDSSGVVTTTAALTTATATTTTTVTTTTAGVTTTTTTTTPTFPEIIGDVLLGNGKNSVNILGGSVTGALSLGNGANGENSSFVLGDDGSITGTAEAALYTGALTYGGTGLRLNVLNGSLINTSATTLNLSSLNVGAKGVLYAAINASDTASPNTLYKVSGTATLASGAQLGVVLNTPLFAEANYTIIQATTLVDNSGGALATTAIPYILRGSETSNAATGAISVDLRPATAAELGLNPAESAALNAISHSLGNDAGIESALLGQYSKSGFLNVYDQLLPDYAGGVFELTLAASDAVTRATSRVNDIENPSGTRGAWAEEVAFGVNRDRSSESAGYQGGGFGFVGGLETGGAGFGAFGLTGSFLTGDIKDPHSPGDNLASFSRRGRRRLLAGPARRPARRRPGRRRLCARLQPARTAAQGRQWQRHAGPRLQGQLLGLYGDRPLRPGLPDAPARLGLFPAAGARRLFLPGPGLLCRARRGKRGRRRLRPVGRQAQRQRDQRHRLARHRRDLRPGLPLASRAGAGLPQRLHRPGRGDHGQLPERQPFHPGSGQHQGRRSGGAPGT